MSQVFKEKFERAWGMEKYVIKARQKGMLIYMENRNNHVEDMVQITEDGEEPIFSCDYLVFDIPLEIHREFFEDIYKDGWMGLQVRSFGEWTEVACHHPQVFHCGVLEVLERLKLIKVTRKEIPNEKGKYPVYINGKGWQIVYNMLSILRESVASGNFMTPASMQKEEEPVEEHSEETSEEEKASMENVALAYSHDLLDDLDEQEHVKHEKKA